MLVALGVPAAAQQFAELGKRHLPSREDATTAVAYGDVDGDGDFDLVIGNHGQSRLYRNDGAGTFTDVTATQLPWNDDPTSCVVLGDVDGDDDLDLLIGNGTYSFPWQNRLYLNDGAGTFTDVTAARLPAHDDLTLAAAFGDVDADDDLDVVFGNAGDTGEQNRLYLNDGTGTFTDATARLPVDNDVTTSVAFGDVDGDTDLDLVIGNTSGAQNLLYLNDGTGMFTDATAARMPAISDLTRSVALGDVDGDLDLDLAIGNGGQNRLYLNDGAGTFSDATATRLPMLSDNSTSVVLGDVDGDLDLDLVVGNTGSVGQQNRLHLNDGAGTFADTTVARMPAVLDQTSSLALGDADGDSDLDLMVGNGDSSRQNRLCLNDGAGTFADATASRMPVDSDATTSVALGDVDGDGDLDLVVGNGVTNSGQQNRLYRNDGPGTFTDVTVGLPTFLDQTNSMALGDVDGDTDLDLVVGNSGNFGLQNRLYLNDGTGTFTDATAGRMPALADRTRSVALGDVDGDTDLDLVIGNTSGAQNRLYLNDGTGTFTDVTAARMPAVGDSTNSVVLGDVDGDTDLDIVVGNNNEQNRLHLNDGTGTFIDATAARMPVDGDYTSSLALGDVDGDTDLDLVVGNRDQQNRLYLNDGTGTFTDATPTRMPVDDDYTTSLAFGDVDGDGGLDILTGNGSRGTRLYRNDGAGTFTDVTAARLPAAIASTNAVALGDVDGDADLDALVGNRDRQNRLLTNLLRQLDTPYLLRVGRAFEVDVHARFGPHSRVEVALPFLATATASIPLPPLGTLRLDPNSLVPLPALVVPQPSGTGSTTVQVPNDPSLAGIVAWVQALLIQYGIADRLTNVTADRVHQ